jgi:Putative auto-transporter adhesin, head GIN domain
MKAHVLLTLALSACSPVFGIQGSGVEATVTRTVEPFQRIRIAGSGDAIVRVGEKQRVTIVCDDNLIEHVRTHVDDGTLELGMERGSYRLKKGLRFEISVPRLTGASIAGSGDIDVSGIDAESFDVSIAGSGEVRASGRAERLDVDIAGSGDAALYPLAARSVEVDIAGSGDVAVSASEDLNAQIFGSGSVHYRGDPRVKRTIAGSGEVSKAK